MNTVTLVNGHKMSEKTFVERIEFLWNALSKDGIDVHMAGKGEDSDIVIKMDEYEPKENFKEALGLGRYKVDVKRVDNRSVLKINIC